MIRHNHVLIQMAGHLEKSLKQMEETVGRVGTERKYKKRIRRRRGWALRTVDVINSFYQWNGSDAERTFLPSLSLSHLRHRVVPIVPPQQLSIVKWGAIRVSVIEYMPHDVYEWIAIAVGINFQMIAYCSVCLSESTAIVSFNWMIALI